ncbi:hypothetical protein K458DRAFT_394449 [Lentithecium fluviatile CBS 122367]|uniref:Uncharacterized protein n=1 Tax=Lentithecium fluviatile CBS 122367 TaxID=1168545 RepID=A0A6G1IKQ4_9PLEO|nr:hypothetical protein K458DRAFT_394449 [Lentithecium fluviatile CBS 122367]
MDNQTIVRDYQASSYNALVMRWFPLADISLLTPVQWKERVLKLWPLEDPERPFPDDGSQPRPARSTDASTEKWIRAVMRLLDARRHQFKGPPPPARNSRCARQPTEMSSGGQSAASQVNTRFRAVCPFYGQAPISFLQLLRAPSPVQYAEVIDLDTPSPQSNPEELQASVADVNFLLDQRLQGDIHTPAYLPARLSQARILPSTVQEKVRTIYELQSTDQFAGEADISFEPAPQWLDFG